MTERGPGVAGGGGFGHAWTTEGAGMDPSDERGEEPWPFFRRPRDYPRSGRASREEARDQRIAEHIQRHREHGARPPRRASGLSRDEIVRTAIAVADAEGPEAISMRRIARELGAGVMSLYWYVESKEELLELMLDAIEAGVDVPDASGDWRADLGTFAHRIRAALVQHRWALDC